MVENDIIDASYIQQQYNMSKRDELLQMHPYKISEGKDKKWRTYLPDKENKRRMIKRNTKKSVEDVVVEYWKEKIENPTIQEVFNEWNDRRRDLNKIAKSTHLRNLKDFERFYGKETKFSQKRIKSISDNDIGCFLEEQISKHNLSAKAFSNLKGITKGMLKYAKKKKYISFNIEEMFYDLDVTDAEFRKTIKNDYEEVFSENEMPIIIDYLINNKDLINLGILLMFITGMRVGELAALKWEDCSNDTIDIKRTETRYIGDDGKPVYDIKNFPKTQAGVRTIVIPNDYIWVLHNIRNINPFGEYVFAKNHDRIRTYKFRKRLYTICEILGIYKKSCHKIRKTYGSILLDNNIDNRLIINQMGHTDIKCTEERYHRNRRSVDKKIQIISSISEFQRRANSM